MHTQSRTLNINNVHIFWTLVAFIATAIFLYGYFVNVTILHTAERQEIEDTIVDLKTDISQLELALIEQNRNLTKEYAYNIGFDSVNELVFVERGNTSLTLNELQP